MYQKIIKKDLKNQKLPKIIKKNLEIEKEYIKNTKINILLKKLENKNNKY